VTDSTEVTSDGAGLPDFRRLPVPEAIRWLAEHGEPADPRTDIDTASLVQRFPHLAAVTTVDDVLAGGHGRIPVRAYRDPTVAPTGRALVWVHGGAFIGGHLDMPESNWVARELASRGIPVLAVDYSKCLAGIHFPVPADDVLTAWRYARAAAPDLLGVAPEALALGGASAGSTLAAGVVIQLVATGEPVPSGLVLVYPVLHPNGRDATAALDPTAPLDELALNYAGSLEALADPRAFPGVGDGAGFPPTLIVVCENDELRPSGEAFVATLERAGVPVDLHLEPGAEHGHIDHPGDPGAQKTLAAMTAWLSR
jgi:acetyl esterase/lipase